MYSQFAHYSSHLECAHSFWQALLKPDDTVIDATCGNGHDTLVLAKLVPQGKVIAFDIQQQAIEETKKRLQEADLLKRVDLRLASHATFSEDLLPQSIALIVYNLGYLPGGNKALTTTSKTTLNSIKKALSLLKPGGAISCTLYPGHSEGEIEKGSLLEFLQTLSAKDWAICHLQWRNRQKSPELLIIHLKK